MPPWLREPLEHYSDPRSKATCRKKQRAARGWTSSTAGAATPESPYFLVPRSDGSVEFEAKITKNIRAGLLTVECRGSRGMPSSSKSSSWPRFPSHSDVMAARHVFTRQTVEPPS